MYGKIYGLIQTYGIRNVAAQVAEKARKRKHPAVSSGEKLIGIDDGSESHYICRGRTCGKSLSVILVVHKFLPDSCGGTEQVTRNLADHLRKMGHKVAICAYSEYARGKYPEKGNGVLWREGTIDEIPVIYFRQERPKLNLFKDIEQDGEQYVSFMKHLQSRFRPDLFHFTHLSRVSGLAQYCRQNRIPYIVTLTDFFAVCHFSTYMQKSGRFCRGSGHGALCAKECRSYAVHQIGRYDRGKEILTSALAVAVPSHFLRRIIQSEIPEVTPLVIPHSVRLARRDRETCTEKSGGRFLYVGRLSEEKGLCTLLRAFRQLPNGCTLAVYGDGRPDFVRKIKREFGGDQRITFEGAIEHEKIGQAYSQADCVVIPSEVPETYCMVLHEALAYGKIVVASRIGAIPEAVREVVNGLLFTPGSADDLYEKMRLATRLKSGSITACDPNYESDAYAEIYERGLCSTWETR